MSEENKKIFEVGDRVSAFGLEGVVLLLDMGRKTYPIKVRFTNGEIEVFTENGKYYEWHLEPSLKLIEKAKRKVKKKFWFFVSDSEIKRRDLSAILYTEPIKADLGCQVVEIELEVEE